MSHPHRAPKRRPALPAVLSIMLLAAAAVPALAENQAFRIDPEHTQIGFKVKHFFSKVPGRFNTFEGSAQLDPADLSKGSVSITIDAASIDTNDAARDKHLRSDAFFAVETYPKITFTSTRVVPAGPDKLKIEGNLTIRGVTRPVTLDVDVLGFGPGYGGLRGGFEARATINRQDFGVKWNDVVEGGGLVLGNDVEILLNVEVLHPKEKKPAAAKGR
jgi:polyisoprenoid-binding protein YceI